MSEFLNTEHFELIDKLKEQCSRVSKEEKVKIINLLLIHSQDKKLVVISKFGLIRLIQI